MKSVIIAAAAVVAIIIIVVAFRGSLTGSPVGPNPVPLAPNGKTASGGLSTTLGMDKARLAWAGVTGASTGLGLISTGAVVGSQALSVLALPAAALACSQLNNPVCNTAGRVVSTAYNAVVPKIPGSQYVAPIADAGGQVVKSTIGKVTSFVGGLF